MKHIKKLPLVSHSHAKLTFYRRPSIILIPIIVLKTIKMQVLTRHRLRDIFHQYSHKHGDHHVEKLLNLRQGFRSFGQPTIFLSSFSAEAELVKHVALFLYHIGYDIYIDWLDQIPVSGGCFYNRHKIKDKIKGLDKFILIATPDALDTNMNHWQLGFADAYKYPDKIAVLHVEDHATLSKNELYADYPHISYEERIDKYGKLKDTVLVTYPNGTVENFERWLRK